MAQRHLIQVEMLWKSILVEAEQADMGWDWVYSISLRLAMGDARFEAYAIE